MRVLITGGAGFIGSHIVDALLKAGHEPIVFDNLSSGSRSNVPDGVRLIESDICDADAVAQAMYDVRPDAVCHQAAQLSVSRSVREPVFDANSNIMGLLHVVDSAVRAGVGRIVFASSGGVLYGDVTSPVDESHPAAPVSPYGISKLAGERYLEFYAREHGISAVALRYSNVYGPRQNPHGEAGVVAIFSKRLLAGQAATINGDGRYVRDYVYGQDVAQANALAISAELDPGLWAFNIGTGLSVDVVELASLIREEVQKVWREEGRTGSVPEFVYGPARPGDLRKNVISPQLAAQVLHWHPQMSLADGIRTTVRWFAKAEVTL